MPEIDTSFVNSLENIYGTAKELLRTQTGAELGTQILPTYYQKRCH